MLRERLNQQVKRHSKFARVNKYMYMPLIGIVVKRERRNARLGFEMYGL